MSDNKNLFIAIFLCVGIMFGFQYLFPSKEATPPPASNASVPVVPAEGAPVLSREDALKGTSRLPIESSSMRGSLNLAGSLFDDLTLIRYHETVNPKSPEIILLSPAGSAGAYYADFTWEETKDVRPPRIWHTTDSALTPETPVTLSSDNGQGLLFQQFISMDDNYMFTITQKVTNTGTMPVSLTPRGTLARRGDPKSSGFFILHEGPVGVFDGKLHDPSYDDLTKTGALQNPKAPGWLGLTDKYWLAALIPDPALPVSSSYTRQGSGDQTLITALYQRDAVTVAPGQTVEVTNHFFAGAKVLRLLDGYQETLGINHFDLAVDFGWFYFLTKPIFYVLEFLKGFLGNFGLAILALTVLLKLAFFPLANKSYASMGRMKALQPEMERLRERYADDKLKMNEKVMELYKREKVNPLAGCLPMIVQIPVFFALYKVLFVSIEMRQAPFYGWIHDLSAPDPTTVFNLFGLIPWDPPSFLMIGAWPLIMGATMFLQQKLSPPPADPAQAKMFLLMPLFFTYLLAQFPAGLVIYWAWNNALSITQQWFIMKRATLKKGKAA